MRGQLFRSRTATWGFAALLFLLAFLPRAIEPISRPVQWYLRSIAFWQALLASSHRLKGAGGAFGYPELTDIAKQIMDCAHKQNETNLNELIQLLNSRCQQISKKAS